MGLFDRLISPHAFDGTGDVPAEVIAASKRIAGLRIKFIGQWSPAGCDLLTTRDVGALLTAAALCAEWLREVTEARNRYRDRIEKLEDSGTVWAEMNDALNERDDRFAKLGRVAEAARQVDAAFYKFGNTPPPLIGLHDAVAALDAPDD